MPPVGGIFNWIIESLAWRDQPLQRVDSFEIPFEMYRLGGQPLPWREQMPQDHSAASAVLDRPAGTNPA
jgi:hypothetical protein